MSSRTRISSWLAFGVGGGDIARHGISGLAQARRERLLDLIERLVEPVLAPKQRDALVELCFSSLVGKSRNTGRCSTMSPMTRSSASVMSLSDAETMTIAQISAPW